MSIAKYSTIVMYQPMTKNRLVFGECMSGSSNPSETKFASMHDPDDEEETVAQKLMRFWKAGYVFSESEEKVLRKLSENYGWKHPSRSWRTCKR